MGSLQGSGGAAGSAGGGQPRGGGCAGDGGGRSAQQQQQNKAPAGAGEGSSEPSSVYKMVSQHPVFSPSLLVSSTANQVDSRPSVLWPSGGGS